MHSRDFARELEGRPTPVPRPKGGKVEDALEEETRRRLDEWRRRRA
jgi:hypothetical protein